MKTIYELNYKGTRTLHTTMITLLIYLFDIGEYTEAQVCETAFYVGTVVVNKQDITLKLSDVVVATIRERVVRP